MASYCMLCDKKLGFFSAWGEDILTGKAGNKICEDCLKKAETIIKKIDMKIPFEQEDFEGFSEEGNKLIKEYLAIYEVDDLCEVEDLCEDAPEEDAEQKEINVGDAVINRSFLVDDEEADAIYQKMLPMKEKELEEFLEGIVSENDTAEGFMMEILSLKDEELSAVLNEQRELYNNAEWAYIRLVEGRRREILEALTKEAEPEAFEEEEPIDEQEVSRMLLQYENMDEEELKEIIEDKTYTSSSREAARRLLQK